MGDQLASIARIVPIRRCHHFGSEFSRGAGVFDGVASVVDPEKLVTSG